MTDGLQPINDVPDPVTGRDKPHLDGKQLVLSGGVQPLHAC